MEAVTTFGLDIAKFEATGIVVIRRQLMRRYVLAFFERLPSCVVGIETCATSYHWSRTLEALGHTVRLMSPAYVKPNVDGRRSMPPMPRQTAKRSPRAQHAIRGDQDARASELCDAPPHMPLLQPAADRRDQRYPPDLAEFGIVARFRRDGVDELLDVVADPSDRRVTEVAHVLPLSVFS